jgi:signal transduction histidine kinase/CheY-like chemotaxis protein
MTLKTVRVPAELGDLFCAAEQVVSRYFRERTDDPGHGTIEIFGERYVLVRAAALSVEFFRVVRELYGESREHEADEFARNILFDLAHAIGKSDARNFHAKMGLSDPIAKLSAGPVHFAHTGWAFVDISPESKPSPDRDFYLLYDHPYSFESDAWRESDSHAAGFPVCIMNAGYSSGWCEESFGLQLVASEILCRANGDEHCRFIMATPERIEARVEDYIQSRPELAPRPRKYEIPDFFARKRLEEELRRHRDELEQRVAVRTAELVAANERLRIEMIEREAAERRLQQGQKMEAIGRMAGGIAHDFNNLLMAISGYSELALSKTDAEDPVHAYMLELRQACTRASDLTRQLLSFSRHQPVQPSVLDLNTVVRDLDGLLRRLIGEDVELSTVTHPRPSPVLADRSAIDQLVVNLAVNARDAMPTGGKLVIETSQIEVEDARREGLGELRPGSYVALSVEDTGVGMDSGTLVHLFEPFFTTKERGKGTGLGLATVHAIVKRYDGAIFVDSAPGVGSTFKVLFPRAAQAPAIAPIAPEIQAPSPAQAHTVLLVEDEPGVRGLLRTVLLQAGFSVFDASDAQRALQLFEQHGAIDLLVTDVVMPGLSGRALAEKLTALRPQLRVLFMSGYTEERIGLHGLAPSECAFLQKPYTLESFLSKVKEVLAPRA